MELANCKKWLIDNKLSLHVGKTESLLFGSRRRLGGVLDFRVTYDGKGRQYQISGGNLGW